MITFFDITSPIDTICRDCGRPYRRFGFRTCQDCADQADADKQREADEELAEINRCNRQSTRDELIADEIINGLELSRRKN